MTHRLTIARFLAAGALMAASAQPARAQADAASACQAMEAAYVAAIASGDAANVAALFTPDGQLNAPEGFFIGTKAIIAYNAGVKPGAKLTTPLKSTVAIGSVMLCSGDYVFTFPPGSPIKQTTGHYSKVLIKTGADYKIAQLTFNYTPPPTPQAQAK